MQDIEPSQMTAVLDRVVTEMDGERRIGQLEFALAVERTIATLGHLVCQAGTGTGKTVAYLVPIILACLRDGLRAVVSTGTIMLQEQLMRDLAMIAEATGLPFTYAQLVGRGNFVCQAAMAELDADDGTLFLDERDRPDQGELNEVRVWLAGTDTGLLAELPQPPSRNVRQAITVTPGECPGRTQCAHGETCWAEKARAEAADAHITVVNNALLISDVLAHGNVLGEYDILVMDEGHKGPTIARERLGTKVTPGRIDNAGRQVAALLRSGHVGDNVTVAHDFSDVAERLFRALAARWKARKAQPERTRLRGGTKANPDVGSIIEDARALVAGAVNQLSKADLSPTLEAKRDRLVRSLRDGLAVDLAMIEVELEGSGKVTYISKAGKASLGITMATVEIAGPLHNSAFKGRAVIITSATIPPDLPQVLDLTDANVIDVGTSLDWRTNAALYAPDYGLTPDGRPIDPRQAPDEWRRRSDTEIVELLKAAGGRTFIAFSSIEELDRVHRMLQQAIRQGALPPLRILAQGDPDLSKRDMLRAFESEPTSVLLGTMAGYGEGMDIRNPDSIRCVIIHRIPFPPADDWVMDALRDKVPGSLRAKLAAVDVPHAATIIAQAAGRGLRSRNHKCVTAVLDPRWHRYKGLRAVLPAELQQSKNRAFALNLLAQPVDTRPAEAAPERPRVAVEPIQLVVAEPEPFQTEPGPERVHNVPDGFYALEERGEVRLYKVKFWKGKRLVIRAQLEAGQVREASGSRLVDRKQVEVLHAIRSMGATPEGQLVAALNFERHVGRRPQRVAS